VPEPDDVRRAELAANLARVRTRIADACAAAGRDRSEVTLVAVTKTYPARDVLHLASLGVRDIGENRDQDAAPKAVAVAVAGESVRWHFVGQLQRNKCRSVAGYAHLVHSVDRPELAVALSRARQRHADTGAVSESLGVLLQISLDDDVARGGVAADDLDRLADETVAQPYLSLRGVMAVAPIGWSPDWAFSRLAELAQRLQVRYPTATVVSAGMSVDLESAVAFGATHVRIGSALLGNRRTLR
jgi:pyridoxal phosphate enzyme (YggS family)